MATIRVGDTGTSVQLTCQEDGAALDVSGASTKQVRIRKPDTTVVTLTASFVNDGTDGIITATGDANTFDLPGTYTAYAYLVIGSWTGTTSAVTIEVKRAGLT